VDIDIDVLEGHNVFTFNVEVSSLKIGPVLVKTYTVKKLYDITQNTTA
jgi:hypothetical protein